MSKQQAINKDKLYRTRLEDLKIKQETKNLRYQNSKSNRNWEKLKIVSGASGLIVGLVSLLALMLSFNQWLDSRQQNLEIRLEERLAKITLNLTDTSKQVRMLAVISMGGFLGKNRSEYHEQVLLSLVNLMTSEGDGDVRNAINQVIKGIDSDKVSADLLKLSLKTLIDYSRYYVNAYDLRRNKISNRYLDAAAGSPEGKAHDIGIAVTSLLRKNIDVRDLSGIFCSKCDFSSLDMLSTNFEDAVLSWSDFSHCNLTGSNFDGADIEGAKFVRANLENSNFTYDREKTPVYHAQYVSDIIAKRHYGINKKGYSGVVFGPDFSYANLTCADFTGHYLFEFNNSSCKPMIYGRPPIFTNAILTDAKLDNITIYGTSIKSNGPMGSVSDIITPIDILGPSSYWGDDSLSVVMYAGQIKYNSRIYDDHLRMFLNSIFSIQNTLSGSNWKDLNMTYHYGYDTTKRRPAFLGPPRKGKQ